MASSPPLHSAAAARAANGAPSAFAASLLSHLARPSPPTRSERRRFVSIPLSYQPAAAPSGAHSILTWYQPTSKTDTMAESKGRGVASTALAGTDAQGGKAVMRGGRYDAIVHRSAIVDKK